MSTTEAGDVSIADVTKEHLSTDSAFEPATHFEQWFRQIETVRNREPAEPSTGVLINGHDLDFEGVVSFDDQLAEKLETAGTLVVTEHGKLEGDVEVTLALIDGVFKGNITATEGVVIENHGVVVGDINTPSLTIRGGAIIEGKCSFTGAREKAVPPVWSVLKDSLAKVWRGRLFQ